MKKSKLAEFIKWAELYDWGKWDFLTHARKLLAEEAAEKHTATNYGGDICICHHIYADGTCHVNCPACNPHNLPCAVSVKMLKSRRNK